MEYENKVKEISKIINNIITDILKPCFKFGEYKKTDDPQNYLAALILNKINSLLVSIDNSLILKDIHLSTYLYRYNYELHIKVAFLFYDKKKLIKRINSFIYNDELHIKNCHDYLNNNKYSFLIKNHDKHYEMLSSIVHPNIESFNIHMKMQEKDSFEFIFKNVALSIMFINQILIILKENNLLELDKNLNSSILLEKIIIIDNLIKD